MAAARTPSPQPETFSLHPPAHKTPSPKRQRHVLPSAEPTRVKSMIVKILYTLRSPTRPSQEFLSRSQTPAQVTVRKVDSRIFGTTQLKPLVNAICRSHPDILSLPNHDYTIATLDAYESYRRFVSTPPESSPRKSAASPTRGGLRLHPSALLEGKGMLSWCLNEDGLGSTSIVGRVVEDELEVWVELVERPTVTQNPNDWLNTLNPRDPFSAPSSSQAPPPSSSNLPRKTGDPVKRTASRSKSRKNPQLDQFAALGPEVLSLLKNSLPGMNNPTDPSSSSSSQNQTPFSLGTEHIPAICMLAKFFGLEIPPGWEERFADNNDDKDLSKLLPLRNAAESSSSRPATSSSSAIAALNTRGSKSHPASSKQQDASSTLVPSSLVPTQGDSFVPIQSEGEVTEPNSKYPRKKPVVFNVSGCANCRIHRTTCWNTGEKSGIRLCRQCAVYFNQKNIHRPLPPPKPVQESSPFYIPPEDNSRGPLIKPKPKTMVESSPVLIGRSNRFYRSMKPSVPQTSPIRQTKRARETTNPRANSVNKKRDPSPSPSQRSSFQRKTSTTSTTRELRRGKTREQTPPHPAQVAVPSYVLTDSPGTALDKILGDTSPFRPNPPILKNIKGGPNSKMALNNTDDDNLETLFSAFGHELKNWVKNPGCDSSLTQTRTTETAEVLALTSETENPFQPFSSTLTSGSSSATYKPPKTVGDDDDSRLSSLTKRLRYTNTNNATSEPQTDADVDMDMIPPSSPPVFNPSNFPTTSSESGDAAGISPFSASTSANTPNNFSLDIANLSASNQKQKANSSTRKSNLTTSQPSSPNKKRKRSDNAGSLLGGNEIDDDDSNSDLESNGNDDEDRTITLTPLLNANNNTNNGTNKIISTTARACFARRPSTWSLDFAASSSSSENNANKNLINDNGCGNFIEQNLADGSDEMSPPQNKRALSPSMWDPSNVIGPTATTGSTAARSASNSSTNSNSTTSSLRSNDNHKNNLNRTTSSAQAIVSAPAAVSSTGSSTVFSTSENDTTFNYDILGLLNINSITPSSPNNNNIINSNNNNYSAGINDVLSCFGESASSNNSNNQHTSLDDWFTSNSMDFITDSTQPPLDLTTIATHDEVQKAHDDFLESLFT